MVAGPTLLIKCSVTREISGHGVTPRHPSDRCRIPTKSPLSAIELHLAMLVVKELDQSLNSKGSSAVAPIPLLTPLTCVLGVGASE
jgi:hypothetical protein